MHLDHATFDDVPPDDALLVDEPVDHQAMAGCAPGPGDQLDPGPAPAPWHDPWHEQERSNSCAVAAQEFILDDFTGRDHSEAELRDVAEAHGWYSEDGGTPVADTGRILAYYGIPTQQHQDATLADLEHSLARGDGVIVGVDSGEIWNPGQDPDDVVGEHLGVPGEGADHAVQVVGIDRSDPANPMVVLHDSGTPDGDGERVPLSTFEQAWEDSDHFMVTAQRPDASLGASYTVDGATDSGNAVEWSTSTNAYHDQTTWEEVTPR